MITSPARLGISAAGWRAVARRAATAASLAYLTALVGLGAAATIPAAVGERPYVVLSASMSPRIAPGTVLVTRPARAADVAVGSVVLVRDPDVPGGTLAHRLMGRDQSGRLITQGDAVATADQRHAAPQDLVGTVRLAVPLIGLPAVWLRSGSWMALGAWIALTVLALALVTTRGMPARHRV